VLGRWNGSAWVDAQVSLTRADLYGIACDPGDPAHAVAVGDGGAVLERVGEGIWRRRVVGQGTDVVGPNLRSVEMSAGLAVAVGAAGTIAESPDGTSWTVVPSGTTQDLATIDAGAGLVLAGGVAATLLERAAGGWAPFAPSIPLSADIVVLRIATDGSVVVGASDGSVWRYASGGAWMSLGTIGAPVSDLRVDGGGVVWAACASGVYQLQGGAFVMLPTGIPAGMPVSFVLTGSTPGWISTGGLVYQRQSDASYASVGGPGANAMTTAMTGRLFIAGAAGAIVAQRSP
jgi:hypothetical protein